MSNGRNIGHIEKRGSGKYRLTIDKGFDENGDRMRFRKTITAVNDKEADKQLALFISEVERGVFFNSTGCTINDLSEIFLKQYCEKNLAQRTYFSYKYELERHILPDIGRIKLKDLKPLHLYNLYNKLREDGARGDGKAGGLSSRTVQYDHSIISCMLNHAKKWDMLVSNPAERVTRPKSQHNEARFYDESQVEQLLIALKSAPRKYFIAVILDLVTGLRRGELVSLEWSDIDFEKKTIKVSKSSQYIPGQGILTKEPKTAQSNRTLSIPDELVVLLMDYKNYQDVIIEDLGNLWVKSNKLFTQKHGEPMHVDTLSSWFRKFIKSNNLQDLNFHGLRHTSASILSAVGVDIASISKRLGHAKPSITSDIYAHALNRVDHHASNVLRDALSLKNLVPIEMEILAPV